MNMLIKKGAEAVEVGGEGCGGEGGEGKGREGEGSVEGGGGVR